MTGLDRGSTGNLGAMEFARFPCFRVFDGISADAPVAQFPGAIDSLGLCLVSVRPRHSRPLLYLQDLVEGGV